ncbi:hypothetical protein KIPB_012595 [Kipferlia bialata]|uniref:Uncharacterized protein n=1 Tax=Kipferlia bialata TaxID=797122 RepID=A0A9K3GN49_9EUKA|nr:hypothetical protein KIPB_012595 [Kipferlia bialata]|eukprot:g12595.t1
MSQSETGKMSRESLGEGGDRPSNTPNPGNAPTGSLSITLPARQGAASPETEAKGGKGERERERPRRRRRGVDSAGETEPDATMSVSSEEPSRDAAGRERERAFKCEYPGGMQC